MAETVEGGGGSALLAHQAAQGEGEEIMFEGLWVMVALIHLVIGLMVWEMIREWEDW